MLAVAFDTLKLARKLESAGMQPKQAQDTSAALSETFTEWLSVGNIATREDLQKLAEKLEDKIGRVEQRLEEKIGIIQEKVGSLETTIAETKTEILRWMFGQTIVLLAALFGLIHISH